VEDVRYYRAVIALHAVCVGALLFEHVRVVFVFREPNLSGRPRPLDMRDEVSDEHFRPRGADGARQERRRSCFWNAKAGLFAHAVSAALDGKSVNRGLTQFANELWHHEVVNRFAYVQIKKVGGGGVSKTDEICAHAAKYAATLKAQMDLYRPHLVLGCGVGPHSPARLLSLHVLTGGREAVTSTSGATWWAFPLTTRPRALVQLWHLSCRGERRELYRDVWGSVLEVAHSVGLDTSAR